MPPVTISVSVRFPYSPQESLLQDFLFSGMLSAISLGPFRRKMVQSDSLLFICQSVQEIKEPLRASIHMLLMFPFSLTVVAYFFPPHNDSAATRRFRKRQHIILAKANMLANIIGNRNTASLTKDTEHLGQTIRPRFLRCHRSMSGHPDFLQS